MKNEINEVMEQLNEVIDPVVLMLAGLYKKMGDNPDMWTGMAKCYRSAVDAFMEAGFTRNEAISMAISSIATLGTKK